KVANWDGLMGSIDGLVGDWLAQADNSGRALYVSFTGRGQVDPGGAVQLESHRPRIGAWRDSQVELELRGHSRKTQVDPRIELAIAHLTVGGDVAVPGVSVISDEVIRLAWKFALTVDGNPGIRVREAKMQACLLFARARPTRSQLQPDLVGREEG